MKIKKVVIYCQECKYPVQVLTEEEAVGVGPCSCKKCKNRDKKEKRPRRRQDENLFEHRRSS